MMKYYKTRLNPSGKGELVMLVLFLVLTVPCMAQRGNLDYYINHAFSNSPLLKDLRNQVASASVDSMIFRAAYRPQVAATSTNAYAPIIGGIGYDEALTTTA